MRSLEFIRHHCIYSIKVLTKFIYYKYFNYRQFQFLGHSRTIIGIEQKANGQTLLVLDPSHGPRQVAALGSNQDSLRLIRRGPNAMKAPQYQIVCVRGLIEKEEEYQASKVMVSRRIPPD